MKICKIPWAGFSNDPDGSVKPCCIYRETIKNSNNENYYIQNDSVYDIFHSDYMNNLRNEFLNGGSPEGCETCWIDESNGYKSKRQIYNQILGDLKIDVNTLNDFPIDYQIIISNNCNLKCRSCGTSHSSEWQKEINNISESIPGKNDYVFKSNMPYGQPGGDGSVFINNFKEFGYSLKRLEIVGGEPFLIKKWEYILNLLIDGGYSKNIELYMSTNGTIFNKKLLLRIGENFRMTGIGLSIDGMGQTYEYLRKNASWEQTKNNILEYYQFHKEYPNLNVNCSYTYTIGWVNAYSLPDFHKWVKINTPGFKIWNNIIHYPPHMSINMLPIEEKERIEEKWKSYDWGEYKNDIDSILKFMNNKHFSDEEIKKYYENFKFFDYIRKENTFDIIKEVYPSLRKYFT